MKSFGKLSMLYLFFSCAVATASAQSSKYKCLLQMSNYMGEGAYITVSLINAQGEYVKTLQVMGEDKKWYKSLKEWYKFYAKKPTNISAITGASLTGGDRSTTTLEIDDAQINKGYKLRFESAVENQKYVKDDVEISLTTAGIAAKTEGKGHIKYVRLIKN